ncbi:MAG: hypothetical protein ACRECW_07415, partial [Phyllobacterium sp.]
SSNPGKGVSPSLLASPPAMILNHKTALQGIPKRFHVTLTDSKAHSEKRETALGQDALQKSNR